VRIAISAMLVVAAAAAAVSARSANPTLTLAGPGVAPVALLLAAAVALGAAGAAAWSRRPRSSTGPLLVGGAVTWCAAQYAVPGAPAVVFTLGLALGAATPAAIALAMEPDRMAGTALAVATVGLLGVGSALVFDPRATDCITCPRNLLLLHGDAGVYDALQRAGLWLGVVAIAWLLLTGGPRPRLAPVTLYLIAVAIDYVHSIPRGYVAADDFDRAWWTVQGFALIAVAGTVLWEPVRERRARAQLAQLVVDLESRPGPRGLEDVLGSVLGDAGLRVAYPLADGRRVDAEGRPVAPGPAITVLDEAELHHRLGLLNDPEVVAAIAGSARLALRRERLHAELRARLEDLRAVRARIVAEADGERRRLERDLHDGAQQRLATLAISIEVARTRADAESAAILAAAHTEVRAALTALREVAHGLVPPVLADEGLGPAVEALAETADANVRVAEPLIAERFAPAVEATAYHVVSEAVRRYGDAAVHIEQGDGRLVVRVDTAVRDALVDVDDRVGALGGTVRIEPGTRLVAELPCA
jgi:signal transduction histidine kinase